MESRRKFIKTSIVASSAILMPWKLIGNEISESESLDNVFSNSIIDFGCSYVCNKADFNSIRLSIESRTTIIDKENGISKVFYQCASCKSENTFGDKDLFYTNNYDFLPVFGDGKVLIFRSNVNYHGEYRAIYTYNDMWGNDPIIYQPKPKRIVELDTWEKIRKATALGAPIVIRTEILDPSSGLIALIECPCKTMNISHIKKMYQVDTGPIVFPDLSKRYENPIESLNLAFIAFNKNSFADFILKVPTFIKDGEKDLLQVYEYSKNISLPTKNRIFALQKIK